MEKTDSNMDFVDAQDMNTMSYVHNPAMGDMSTLPGQQTTWKNFLCKSSHPVVAAFHLLFKLMAILTYMFANWMGLDFVTCFVLVVLFLAADFWVSIVTFTLVSALSYLLPSYHRLSRTLLDAFLCDCVGGTV